jgi:hypothetical protein
MPATEEKVFTFRVGPSNVFEVGEPGPDVTDPRQFKVLAVTLDQQEAAALVNYFAAGGDPAAIAQRNQDALKAQNEAAEKARASAHPAQPAPTADEAEHHESRHGRGRR